MKSFAFALIASAAFVFAGSAHAGWKNSGYDSKQKSSLINVSPSVDLGGLLKGVGVLNNSPIASGNVVSGILSGNNTSLSNGILGSVTNVLGHAKTTKKGR